MAVADIGRHFGSEFAYLKSDLDKLAALANELKTELSGHTHGGVAEGSGDTQAGPTITADDVTIQTK